MKNSSDFKLNRKHLQHLKFFLSFPALFSGVQLENLVSVIPGPVEVKEGDSVELWCKLTYDKDKQIPLQWQSPPVFNSRTFECASYNEDKYMIDCSKTDKPHKFYNMTVKKVQWSDNGSYRCNYMNYVSHLGVVELKVLGKFSWLICVISCHTNSSFLPMTPLFL